MIKKLLGSITVGTIVLLAFIGAVCLTSTWPYYNNEEKNKQCQCIFGE